MYSHFRISFEFIMDDLREMGYWFPNELESQKVGWKILGMDRDAIARKKKKMNFLNRKMNGETEGWQWFEDVFLIYSTAPARSGLGFFVSMVWGMKRSVAILTTNTEKEVWLWLGSPRSMGDLSLGLKWTSLAVFHGNNLSFRFCSVANAG